jgi:hypothetical protein
MTGAGNGDEFDLGDRLRGGFTFRIAGAPHDDVDGFGRRITIFRRGGANRALVREHVLQAANRSHEGFAANLVGIVQALVEFGRGAPHGILGEFLELRESLRLGRLEHRGQVPGDAIDQLAVDRVPAGGRLPRRENVGRGQFRVRDLEIHPRGNRLPDLLVDRVGQRRGARVGDEHGQYKEAHPHHRWENANPAGQRADERLAGSGARLPGPFPPSRVFSRCSEHFGYSSMPAVSIPGRFRVSRWPIDSLKDRRDRPPTSTPFDPPAPANLIPG